MNTFLKMIVLFFIFSCYNSKTVIQKTISNPAINDYNNVTISIKKYIPYCGGAAPTWEMENNYQVIQGEFILINQNLDSQKVVKSDSLGTIYLKLNAGKYSIREEYKNVSFIDFYNNNQSNGMYITNQGEECYKKWWKRNLLNFEVVKDSVLVLNTEIGSSCYIGINPCLRYNGPQRP